jgi:hypothetical protein
LSSAIDRAASRTTRQDRGQARAIAARTFHFVASLAWRARA